MEKKKTKEKKAPGILKQINLSPKKSMTNNKNKPMDSKITETPVHKNAEKILYTTPKEELHRDSLRVLSTEKNQSLINKIDQEYNQETKKKVNEQGKEQNHVHLTSNKKSQSEKIEDKRIYKKYQKISTLVNDDISINIKKLSELAWSGLPIQIRGISWKLLLGYIPVNNNNNRRQMILDRRREEYNKYVAEYYDIDDNQRSDSENKILRQIRLDVPRTCQKQALFQQDIVKNILERVLYIWSIRHTASGYVQGINDLATPFFITFLLDSVYFHHHNHIPEHINTNIYSLINEIDINSLDAILLKNIEADTFMCLTQLLNGIQDHYTHAQPGIQTKVFRLSELIKRIDENLYHHLIQENVPFMHFAYRWMNCLLMRELSLSLVIRLWDTYISEASNPTGNGYSDYHVYVCAAFLMSFATELKKEFQDLVIYLQNLPTEKWTTKDIESLLSQAFIYKSLFHDAHQI